MRRALDRRKPFAENGAGYRDALLWETVLELVESVDDLIVVITNNTKDFAADASGEVLAADLLADLGRAGATERVRLLRDLTAFREAFVSQETVAIDGLLASLNAQTALRTDVEARLRQSVTDRRFERDDLARLEDVDLDVRGKASALSINAACLVEPLDLYQVWLYEPRLVEGQVVAELEAEMELELDVSY